jgi:hypothetical protein
MRCMYLYGWVSNGKDCKRLAEETEQTVGSKILYLGILLVRILASTHFRQILSLK